MSNITVDSRVRIGNGKVEYTVFAVTEKGFNLQDDKGRNRYDVPADKLTVINHASVETALTLGEEESFEATKRKAYVEIAETNPGLLSNETFAQLMDTVDAYVDGEGLKAAEVSWDLAVKEIVATLPLGTFIITDDNPPREFKSFEAAAFALSRDHMYAHAVIVRDNIVRVTR